MTIISSVMTGTGRAAARVTAADAGVKQRNQGMGAPPVPPPGGAPEGGEGVTAPVIQSRDTTEL